MKCKHQPKQTQHLINLIHMQNRLRGNTLRDLAALLGISHIHMASLSNGARKLSGLDPEKQRKLTEYLRINMIEFYLMIGMLRAEDLMSGKPA